MAEQFARNSQGVLVGAQRTRLHAAPDRGKPLAEVLIERRLVRVDVPPGAGFGPDFRQRVSRLPQRVERVRDLPALAVRPARRVGDEPVAHLPGFQSDLLDRFPGH